WESWGAHSSGSDSGARTLVGAQPIADSCLRQNVTRPLWIGLQLVAQVLDADSQSARVMYPVRSPDLPNQLRLANDHACVAGQAFEQAILQRGEMDVSLRSACAPVAEIDLHVAQMQPRVLLGAAGIATQPGAYSRQQFRRGKRLGDVIIGSGIERGDLLVLERSGRQHDDRHR